MATPDIFLMYSLTQDANGTKLQFYPNGVFGWEGKEQQILCKKSKLGSEQFSTVG
ncbi:hypothetical protein COLO4_27618 [Corchorus olitorius]|uniref:Uncharacterized protein n=1 Tax=Corchorus olitorius TaxID=93759 RepID=A0A1R3HPT5_9ROSI|nr:hypothetical protein COLO4_27618 [Corchorus olitorius]